MVGAARRGETERQTRGLTDWQAPAEPEQLPGGAGGVAHDELDILATGELGVLTEGLDDEVAEATVRVDRALVGLDDRLGELGGPQRPMVVVEQLACVLAAGEGFKAGYAVSTGAGVSVSHGTSEANEGVSFLWVAGRSLARKFKGMLEGDVIDCGLGSFRVG